MQIAISCIRAIAALDPAAVSSEARRLEEILRGLQQMHAEPGAGAAAAAESVPEISISERLDQLTLLNARVDRLFQQARDVAERRIALSEECAKMKEVHVAYRPDGAHRFAQDEVRSDAAKIRDDVCAVDISLTSEFWAATGGRPAWAASAEHAPDAPLLVRSVSSAIGVIEDIAQQAAAFRAEAREILREMRAVKVELHAAENPKAIIAAMFGGQAVVSRVATIRARLSWITLSVQ